jgi:hypothetical protein
MKVQHVWIVEIVAQSGLSITVVNTGRRPLTISDVFLAFKNGDSLIFPTSAFYGGSGLPKVLEENTAYTATILAGDMGADLLVKQEYPVAACFRSATGRIYRRTISNKLWDAVYKVKDPE